MPVSLRGRAWHERDRVPAAHDERVPQPAASAAPTLRVILANELLAASHMLGPWQQPQRIADRFERKSELETWQLVTKKLPGPNPASSN